MLSQVNGYDVKNVPQHVFFNMLRATDRLAKIQIMKIPVAKVGCFSYLADKRPSQVAACCLVKSHLGYIFSSFPYTVFRTVVSLNFTIFCLLINSLSSKPKVLTLLIDYYSFL